MESKIHATERLRSEGRWGEASAYRDDVRKRLRAEGKPKTEANELAWEAMIGQFPPQPLEAGTVRGLDLSADNEISEELPPPCDAKKLDLVGDALWVYENLENRFAAAMAAPSLGAWGLLKWARKDPDRFFENLFPKMIAAKQKQVTEREWADEEDDPEMNELKALLEEVSGRSFNDK